MTNEVSEMIRSLIETINEGFVYLLNNDKFELDSISFRILRDTIEAVKVVSEIIITSNSFIATEMDYYELNKFQDSLAEVIDALLVESTNEVLLQNFYSSKFKSWEQNVQKLIDNSLN